MDGRLRKDVPLSQYTTLGVGGAATRYWEVADGHCLAEIVRRTRSDGSPVKCIGRGSNVLVHDRGVRGLLVRMADRFAAISVEPPYLIAQAGAALPSLLQHCCDHGLLDLSCCAGIPGSCGGAVCGNAGQGGRSIADKIAWVELWASETGAFHRRPAGEMGFQHRRSILQQDGLLVTRVAFRLERGDGKLWAKKAAESLARREGTHPRSVRSAGSFFRNPPGEAAGALIDRAGLKGARVGEAMVSPVHANFLVNRGRARSDDFFDLIRLVRRGVFENVGIWLELEVQLLGFTEDEVAELSSETR